MKKYTRAVYRQRLGKHFSAATDTYATVEVLSETGRFCVVRADML
jgi:radical SAM superfamily enzyme